MVPEFEKEANVSHKHGKGIVPAFMSNLVSIPLDSAAIAVIGFYGDVPNEVVLSIFVINCVIKFAMTTACLPLAKKRMKDGETREAIGLTID